jgi:hypothetical protein
LSDGDNDGQNEPAGDDAGSQGVLWTELNAPNSIGFDVMEQIRSSTADQTTTAAPSGSNQ